MKSKLENSIILSNDIDETLNTFVSTIENCASPLFLHQLKRIDNQTNNSDDNGRNRSNAPWFTEECSDYRGTFYMCLDLYRGDKSAENRINLVNARSQYKTCLRRARLAYDKTETDRLNKLRYKNARDYWKLLKSASQSSKSNIPLSSIERYFKAINTPDSDFYVPDDDILFTNDMYIRGETDVMFDELNLPLSRDEILKGIKQLKNNKGAGPDKLINEFF